MHAGFSDTVWYELVTIVVLPTESVRVEKCATFEVKLQQERETCVTQTGFLMCVYVVCM